jgi:hypothetical protein
VDRKLISWPPRIRGRRGMIGRLAPKHHTPIRAVRGVLESKQPAHPVERSHGDLEGHAACLPGGHENLLLGAPSAARRRKPIVLVRVQTDELEGAGSRCGRGLPESLGGDRADPRPSREIRSRGRRPGHPRPPESCRGRARLRAAYQLDVARRRAHDRPGAHRIEPRPASAFARPQPTLAQQRLAERPAHPAVGVTPKQAALAGSRPDGCQAPHVGQVRLRASFRGSRGSQSAHLRVFRLARAPRAARPRPRSSLLPFAPGPSSLAAEPRRGGSHP